MNCSHLALIFAESQDFVCLSPGLYDGSQRMKKLQVTIVTVNAKCNKARVLNDYYDILLS